MTSPGRVHVVLVPGFAGFDALGQLEYYAGVTPVYRRWQATPGADTPLVLHYFDNLPTASIATRAGRLRSFLAKRCARGEIQGDDTIALVGHSTGGLDIRRLLRDLHLESRQAGTPFAVDGDCEDAVPVTPDEILYRVKRVAFLSTPQRGTNIADWAQRVPRGLLLAPGRLLARAATQKLANDLAEGAARWLGRTIRSDVLLALADAVAEMDARQVRDDPARAADALDAASEIQLFLAHVAADFRAIHDLTAAPAPTRESPAHFDEEQRRQELLAWQSWGIATRSYATLGTRPYRFGPGEDVPVWDPRRPRTGPWSGLRAGMAARLDPVYLGAYRACAGGPFAAHAPPGPLEARDLLTETHRTIEPWDNDGIVNTASMLWPDGPDTFLIDGDHGDIIGHHRLAEAAGCSLLRRFHTYDLLRSDSGFTETTFERIWQDVFGFCAGALAGRAVRESRRGAL